MTFPSGQSGGYVELRQLLAGAAAGAAAGAGRVWWFGDASRANVTNVKDTFLLRLLQERRPDELTMYVRQG